jgi:hypothetical protein
VCSVVRGAGGGVDFNAGGGEEGDFNAGERRRYTHTDRAPPVSSIPTGGAASTLLAQ